MKKQQLTETHASSQAAAKPQVFERLGPRARDSQGKLLFKLQSSNNSATKKNSFLCILPVVASQQKH